MKVTATLRQHLIDSAREARDLAKKELVEAERNLAWAQSQRVGYELTNYVQPSFTTVNTTSSTSYLDLVTTRYYIPSKSGLTQGHYIRRFDSGKVDCTCPGFVNRGYCWASNQVKNHITSNTFIWNKSIAIFDSNRDTALRLANA